MFVSSGSGLAVLEAEFILGMTSEHTLPLGFTEVQSWDFKLFVIIWPSYMEECS